jgi:hypothetical protein
MDGPKGAALLYDCLLRFWWQPASELRTHMSHTSASLWPTSSAPVSCTDAGSASPPARSASSPVCLLSAATMSRSLTSVVMPPMVSSPKSQLR